MADSKNTQTTPARLPEKEWYTLEEVAGRWGCATDEILAYGQGDLVVCARIKARIARFEQHPSVINLFIEGEDPEEPRREWVKVSDWKTVLAPLPLYPDDVRSIQRGERITPTMFMSDDYHFSMNDYNAEVSYLARQAEEIGIKDLVIARCEIERLEDAHGLRQLPKVLQAGHDWKVRAREIAATLDPAIKQDVRAKQIAQQLDSERVRGRGGKELAASTIAREILRRPRSKR